MKCSVYIATSVDGFIAGPNGDIEWLHRPEYEITKMDGISYESFIRDVDAIVMGRSTFDKVLSFDQWYYEKPVVVLTNRKLIIPGLIKDKVHRDSGDPASIVERLSAKGYRKLYIDGGITIQQFLAAGLIDEMIITRIPILLGNGIPLFSSEASETRLKLVDAVSSGNGFVQEHYSIIS